ncbi:hypothetical protein GPECTOR_17g904 [Gonium pectorale]|uniref:Ion transport domain-containing protein n=1 Tax=Gonium pectorale TaxID=33097 RepID=A0A150GKL4_GONPE|nr:hypothetical protein GPECTOR_17g904 [Gonium pectorale]|eukprot:KXZ50265.1 hypothetical protein GPECTOR_17g904 [Gonium pectorale]
MLSMQGVCFSPDGTYVMRWGYGTDVKLLSSDDGMLVITMVAPTPGPVRFATFNSDGSKVAVATEDCKVYVWVTANKHLLCTLDVGAEPLAHVVFSQDSKHLLSCDDEGQLELWSIATATMVRRYDTGHISKRCGFSSNGESVLSCAGDDCGLLILNARTGALQVSQQFEEVAESRNRASYVISPDGNKVLLFILEQVYGINLVLYHLETDTHIPLMVCDGAVTHAEFSNDSSLFITAGRDDLIHVWESDTGMLRTTLQGHASDVMFCKISEEGEVAISGDSEGMVLVWSLADGSCVMRLQAHSAPIAYVDVNADGTRALTVDTEGHALLWYLDAARAFEVLRQHSDLVACVVPTPDGTSLVVGYKDGCLRCWNVSDGPGLAANVTWTHTKQACPVEQLAMRPDGAQVAAAGRDGTVIVTDMRRGAVTAVLNGHNDFVTGLMFSERSDLLVSASRVGEVSVWNARAYGTEPIRCLTVPELLEVAALAISPQQAYLAAATAGGTVHIWSLATFHAQADVKVTDLPATRITFNSDGSVLAVAAADGSVTLIDPLSGMRAAHYRGNASSITDVAFMMKPGTTLTSAPNGFPLVLYCAPDTTVRMMSDETGGTRCLDFSSDGRLLVSGNLRGELVVWDVVHQEQMHKWVAHKRYAITCVRFTHDATAVYSCAEDCKVIMWDWRRQTKLAVLTGHQAPVAAVEMSVDGDQMASGDRDGFIFIWDTHTHAPKQVIPAHDGAVLCCSLSPCGTMVASTGADEHIVVLDVHTGQQLATLDDAMDGKGLTIKFSFDGTRLLVGGEKGAVLIWDVARNCLLYDIPAHDGKVFDCGWSGDSRRLLSVGSDGRARLWDAAAGSELCQANFDRIMGAVESGGFLHCDLSATGNRMAGCTAKGQLIDWDVGAELRCVPEGSMLYQRLSALSLGRSRDIYSRLLRQFPLLPNIQDSRGWTILMHAVANSNPEITKLIVASVPPASGKLGLTASAVQNTILSSIRHVPRVQMLASAAAASGKGWEGGNSKRMSISNPDGAVSATSVTKLSSHKSVGQLGRRPSAGLDQQDPDDDDDDDSSGTGSATRPSPGPSVASAPAAAAPPGPSLLGRVGTFLRSGAELLTPQRSRSRDLEDGTEDGVDMRHVSDLGRNAWQEDDPDGKAPPAVKDGLGRGSSKVWPDTQPQERTEPNAVKIALEAGAADCVQHVLDAVLAQKVTPGSYHAITQAIPAVAQQYPTMCQVFLSGLPLRPLGEMEVPSSIAARGMIVTSAPSYTSYKEMWMSELQLQGQGNKGPMALMEACMVRLPFAAASGKTSVLHTLVESGVPVQTFGSDTVKAIVDYKWRNFAQRRIYIKALVYLLYTVLFTVFAVLFADHDSTASITGLYDTTRGVAIVVFAGVLFLYGMYFLVLEFVQLASLGASAYFDSFWNIVDIAAYVTTLVVCPCTVFRYGLQQGEFVAALVAAEVIMLWVKVLFYGLAIDGVGTFIFMTAEIIKGLKFFISLLATLFISFAVAFMVLFRNAPDVNADGSSGLGLLYGNFGNSLLNVYLVMFQQGDPHGALTSEYSHFAVLLYCVYMFAVLVVLLNMIITLMADIFQKVKGIQHFVFLKGRAELIIDVESTTGGSLSNADNHPYLHLLMPLRKDNASSSQRQAGDLTAVLARPGGGVTGPAGGPPGSNTAGAVGTPSRAVSQTGGGGGRSTLAEPLSDSDSDDDDTRSGAGGGRALSRMASFKSAKSVAPVARRQTDAYTTLGAMTMVRRPGGGVVTATGTVDTERLERLERTINRLSNNLDTVMNHLKVRQPSTTGGPGGLGPGLGGGGGGAATMAADVAAMVSPLGRRGAGIRNTAGGVGAISMVVRGSKSTEPLAFGLPGSIVSRAASRPTSAIPSGAPPPLPLLPMLGVTASVRPSSGGPQPGQAGPGANSHAHLHATFADDAPHESGASTARGGLPVSPNTTPIGNTASARISTNGASPAVLAAAGFGSGRPQPPEAIPAPAPLPPPVPGPSAGPGSSGSAISSGGKRRSLIAEAPPPASSILEGDEGVEGVLLMDTMAPQISLATLPMPGSNRSAPGGVGGANDAPRLGSRDGIASEPPGSRNGSSPPSGGGVATAARLVLDPEEPQAWNGSGPGRPSGSMNSTSVHDPPRIRTPGEVEPSG